MSDGFYLLALITSFGALFFRYKLMAWAALFVSFALVSNLTKVEQDVKSIVIAVLYVCVDVA